MRILILTAVYYTLTNKTVLHCIVPRERRETTTKSTYSTVVQQNVCRAYDAIVQYSSTVVTEVTSVINVTVIDTIYYYSTGTVL